MSTPTIDELNNQISHLEAFAASDARKIKRLVEMLVRADQALATVGVGKKSPVRVNINTCIKET